MGFWSLGRKRENAGKEKVEATEEKKSPEEEQIDQLVEKTISYVMSASYKGDKGLLSSDEFGFKRGQRILTRRTDYMPLFKKGLKQYIIGWKSATNAFPSETELTKTVTDAVYRFYNLENFNLQLSIYNILELNAGGKYNDYKAINFLENFFPDPVKEAKTMKRIEKEINEKKLLDERIEKLKAIVNKPIKYGDSGTNNEEISFDEEFNNFAEKLREQKMKEMTIFKLVTRMGELRKQYETVIRHPDKSLMQRLEAQVLLEYYEQIKKQKEAKEKAEYEEIMKKDSGLDTGNLSNSINEIKEDVSTLT